MKLKDTAKLMESGDYKDRFKAEYYQLKIRLNGLSEMLKSIRQAHCLLNRLVNMKRCINSMFIWQIISWIWS